jgi:hypothetical protein
MRTRFSPSFTTHFYHLLLGLALLLVATACADNPVSSPEASATPHSTATQPPSGTPTPSATAPEVDAKKTLIAANELTKAVRVSSITPTPSRTPRPTPTAGWALEGEPNGSPDGTWVASHYRSWEQGQSFWILAVEKDDRTQTLIVDKAPVAATGPINDFSIFHAWSADGASLYFTRDSFQDGCGASGRAARSLSRFDLESGSSQVLLDQPVRWFEISPDESMIAHVGYGQSPMELLFPKSGENLVFPSLVEGESAWLTAFTWSADNRLLAYTITLSPCAFDRGVLIVILDVANGTQTVVFEYLRPEEEAANLYFSEAWVDPRTLLISDWQLNQYHLDIHTGELTLLEN